MSIGNIKKKIKQKKAEEGAKPPKQSPAAEGPAETPGPLPARKPPLKIPSVAQPLQALDSKLKDIRMDEAQLDKHNVDAVNATVGSLNIAHRELVEGKKNFDESYVMKEMDRIKEYAEKVKDPKRKGVALAKLAIAGAGFSGPLQSDAIKDKALAICDTIDESKSGSVAGLKLTINKLREHVPSKPVEPEEKQDDAQKPEETAGQVAIPIDEEKPESTYESFEDEEKDAEETEKPEDEKATKESVVVPPLTEEQRDSIVKNAPDQVLAKEVSAAIGKSKYDEALQKALKMKDKDLRNEKIENIADEYAKKGNYKKARTIADSIEDPLFRARVVKEFATEFQMESKDPKVRIKAGKTLRDAIRIAETAVPNQARSDMIKDIESAETEFEDMKRRDPKVRKYLNKRTRRRWILGLSGAALSLALGGLIDIYSDDIKAFIKGEKPKTEQVAAETEPVDLSGKVDVADFEHLGEKVSLLMPMGKSTGLYDGMTNLSGEERDELDYSKLKDGKVRKFEEVDKDLAEAVKETEVKEKLDEIASIDFEGEDELTELDKVTRQLDLVNAKLDELAEHGQSDEKLEALKAVLEEKEQLLKLAEIVAAYKTGYHDDFCGTIKIDIQDISCEEDQWIVLTDKNGVHMRVLVYDEPVDCPTDCPKGKGGPKVEEITIRRGG